MTIRYGDWEQLKRLGGGGQSDVFLARKPERVAARNVSFETVKRLSGQGLNAIKVAEEFAKATWDLARPDFPNELGALKIFKIRDDGAAAAARLKAEIAILSENRPNLPQLLEGNEADQWLVTEYFPQGTLEDSPERYKGNAAGALRAFHFLVKTVAESLHRANDTIVHRDIKPGNVFISTDDKLIPGDFGIVFRPNLVPRVTSTDERVGPRDYMPQWGHMGDRLENVQPNFDVYMLGKLLWCIVAGRLILPREYHRWPEFDLAKMFPAQKLEMNFINGILDKCLVERPESCLRSATELLPLVEAALSAIERRQPMLGKGGDPILPCPMCKKGVYQRHGGVGFHQVFDERNMPLNAVRFQLYVCNVCTHYAFFSPGNPKEAAARDWTPWTPLQT